MTLKLRHFLLSLCALLGAAVLLAQPVSAATTMDSHNIFEIYDDTGSGGGTDTGGSGDGQGTTGESTGTGDGTQTGTSTTDKATPSNLATRVARTATGGSQHVGIGTWLNEKSGGRLPALNGLSDFWLMLMGIQIMIIVALSAAIIWQQRRVRVTVKNNE